MNIRSIKLFFTLTFLFGIFIFINISKAESLEPSAQSCIEKYGETAYYENGNCFYCESKNSYRDKNTGKCVCEDGYGAIGNICVPVLDFCIHNYGINVIVKENNCLCDFGYKLNKDGKCDMAMNVCKDNFGSEYTFYNGKCIHKNDVAKNQRISSDQKYNSYMFVFTLVGIFLFLTSIVLIRKFIFKKNSKKFIKIILYVVGAYIVLYVSNMVWILFE